MILSTFSIQMSGVYFLPYAGDVYKLTLSSPALPAYWLTWLDDDSATAERFLIESVEISSTTVYTLKTDLATCVSTSESFYFDFSSQTLYVHFSVNPDAVSNLIGDITGYTNQHTIYIDGQEYAPYLKTIPSISKAVDPLEASKMTFKNQTLTLINSTGEQDRFIDDPIPGVLVELLHYDEDTEATTAIYSGYITSDSYDMDEARFVETDSRQRGNVMCPTTKYDKTTYVNLDDKLDGKVIPNIYGTVKGAVCNALNGDDESATHYTFQPCEYISTLTQVYVEEEKGHYTAKTASSTDLSNGIFYLTAADCTDDNGKLQKVKANLTGRVLSSAPDIIKDLNDTYDNVTYNTSNYNTTEWTAEAAKVGGSCYLNMNEEKPLFEWIEELQNAGNRQFIYDIQADGLRTLRTYDPDRTETLDIANWQLLSQSGERDFEFYASKVSVDYQQDFMDDTAPTVSNTDYQTDRIATYGHPNDYTVPIDHAGLDNSTDAGTKADNIAEKYEPQMVFTVDIFIDDPEMFEDIKLFATGSIDFENTDLGREFFGSRRVIVEEFSFNLSNNTVQLKMRERATL